MISQNGIIEGFKPTFRSIGKDCNRYSDTLLSLIDSQIIDSRDYIQLSGTGSLWIAFQYIENGRLDMVEAHVTGHVTSRDFYGPLFENTQAILNYLVDHSEQDRVFSVYRAAITHRLKALKAEAKIKARSRPDSHAWKASKQWVDTYLPTTRKMIEDYKALVAETHGSASDVQGFDQSIKEITLYQGGP